MITARVLSEPGEYPTHPDVAFGHDGSPVVTYAHRGTVVLRWLSEIPGPWMHTIETGSPDSPYPRLVRRRGQDDLWLAYRAIRDGVSCAVLRDVPPHALGAALGDERILGQTAGSNSICLSDDGWVAWQDWQAGEVLGLFDGTPSVLSSALRAGLASRGLSHPMPVPQARHLRPTVHPSGLSRITGLHYPIFVSEDHWAESGLVFPSYAAGVVVGEHEHGPDLLVKRYDGPTTVLLAGPYRRPRVAARGDGDYAAVTWGPDLQLLRFTDADLR